PRTWKGIDLRSFRGILPGALGTILFDLQATVSSLFFPGIKLVLGYNTGFLIWFYALFGQKAVTNVDGLEFARSKYGKPAALWLRVNEFFALRASRYIVADHPEIGRRCEQLGFGEK